MCVCVCVCVHVCCSKPVKIAQNNIFIATKHLICSKVENKAISSQICNWIRFWSQQSTSFLVIPIFDKWTLKKCWLVSFLNRSINIIMDSCHNKKLTYSQVILILYLHFNHFIQEQNSSLLSVNLIKLPNTKMNWKKEKENFSGIIPSI